MFPYSSSSFLSILCWSLAVRATSNPDVSSIQVFSITESKIRKNASYSKPMGLGHVLHFPLERRDVLTSSLEARKRSAEAGAIGLGDAGDITYNVLVQVGEVVTPVVLDTGSSDLWVLSNKCANCCEVPRLGGDISMYILGSMHESGVGIEIIYGDSLTGTRALGTIGFDVAGIAGLPLERQFFAAMNSTNTSVVQTGSAGILGIGFPVNSNILNELYTEQLSMLRSRRRRHIGGSYPRPRTFSTHLQPLAGQIIDLNSDNRNPVSFGSADILSAFAQYGPPISRLVMNADTKNIGSPYLAAPQVSITLQRTTPSQNGSLPGLFTLGGLPPDVTDDSLTWVPVRLYTAEQKGLIVPQAPGELYPYTWEIILEDVYFDGVKLPRSTLGDSGKVELTALIDTGNSLVRGPSDVIASMLSLLTHSAVPPTSLYAAKYPCSEAHTLSFQFNGRMFDVDPRDFGTQVDKDDVQWCIPNVASTDPPVIGDFLYSWSLGDPFLKSVLSSFYYGNVTHPSIDPPRIGLLSMVPGNASALLEEAVIDVKQHGGNFPDITISAPSGTFSTVQMTASVHDSGTTTDGLQAKGAEPGARSCSTSSAPPLKYLWPFWMGLVAAVCLVRWF